MHLVIKRHERMYKIQMTSKRERMNVPLKPVPVDGHDAPEPDCQTQRIRWSTNPLVHIQKLQLFFWHNNKSQEITGAAWIHGRGDVNTCRKPCGDQISPATQKADEPPKRFSKVLETYLFLCKCVSYIRSGLNLTNRP